MGKFWPRGLVVEKKVLDPGDKTHCVTRKRGGKTVIQRVRPEALARPTEAQVEVFWKRCAVVGRNGWREADVVFRAGYYCGHQFISEDVPPVDPSNLIRYAVPKLEAEDYHISLVLTGLRPRQWVAQVTKWGKSLKGVPSGTECLAYGHAKDSDFSLAFFWAAWVAWGL